MNQLAVLDAVATAGSVTRGAERLMVSQPAVSKQLKLLERAVQTPLLERNGRGVRLTPAGRVLASYAQRIFALADEAQAAVGDVAALRRGSLLVGATPTIATYLLPTALVYFRQRFPGVRVQVETASAQVLRARLLADDGMELGLGDETLSFAGMQRRAFMRAPFVAIAPPGHPLARRRRVSLRDLVQTAMVVREAESSEASLVERYLAESADGAAPEASLSLGSTEAVKRAVESGLGIAIVPRLSVEGEIAARRLVALRVPELTLSRTLYEVWNSRRPLSKAARAFHCVLEHAARGTLPPPPAAARRVAE